MRSNLLLALLTVTHHTIVLLLLVRPPAPNLASPERHAQCGEAELYARAAVCAARRPTGRVRTRLRRSQRDWLLLLGAGCFGPRGSLACADWVGDWHGHGPVVQSLSTRRLRRLERELRPHLSRRCAERALAAPLLRRETTEWGTGCVAVRTSRCSISKSHSRARTLLESIKSCENGARCLPPQPPQWRRAEHSPYCSSSFRPRAR